MVSYDGSQGYGRIGNFAITAETNPRSIIKHISPELNNLIRKHFKAVGVKFNPYTYTTVTDGMIEIIKDDNGKVYGYDHGSYSSWGF